MVCQFFTGSWGCHFMDWLGEGRGLKEKITPGKFILFEMSYFSIQWLLKLTERWRHRDCDTTLKPLHANWVINTHNHMSQCPELIKNGFRKLGLLSDHYTINYVHACLFIYIYFRDRLLHTIPFSLKCSIKFYLLFRWGCKFVDEGYTRIPRKLSHHEF